MPHSTRVFRVFVSSTFRDMAAERAALHRRVFPRLRQLCVRRGLLFQPIDLRWGVAEEAAASHLTMRICLEEIRRCRATTRRPNFIALLGDRYGWRPLPEEIPAAEFAMVHALLPGADARTLLESWYLRDDNAVPPVHVLRTRARGTSAQEWAEVGRDLHALLAHASEKLPLPLSRRRRYFASATEQEVDEGIFQAPQAHASAFCFFRTITKTDARERMADYFDIGTSGEPDTWARALQENLRANLCAHLPEGNVVAYKAVLGNSGLSTDHLEGFCEDVYARLLGAMALDAEGEAAVREEPGGQQKFQADRVAYFTGRMETLDRVAAYLKGTEPLPLVLHGAAGAGKSSVMAAASRDAALAHLEAQIAVRFIGATTDSTSEVGLLEGLAHELGGSDPHHGPPESSAADRALRRFRRSLDAAAADGRQLLLFIDALDQLGSAAVGPSLAWIPEELPPGVRLVLSTAPGEALQKLSARSPAPRLESLPPMPRDEGSALLHKWLASAGRTLQPAQREAVLAGFASNGLPLYLRLAFEEARRWRSDTEFRRSKTTYLESFAIFWSSSQRIGTTGELFSPTPSATWRRRGTALGRRNCWMFSPVIGR